MFTRHLLSIFVLGLAGLLNGRTIWANGAVPFDVPASGREVGPLAFTPDGKILAVAFTTGVIELRNCADGSFAGAIQCGEPVSELAFSASGDRLAGIGRNTKIRVWSVATHEELFELEGHTSNVRALAWSPDGAWLASGADDGKTLVWNTKDRTVAKVLRDHPHALCSSLAFSPNGKYLVAAWLSGSLEMWSVPAFESTWSLDAQEMSVVENIAFSPDSKSIASPGKNLRFWTFPSYDDDLVWSHERCGDVSFSPDGSLLAVTIFDNGVDIYEVKTRKKLIRFAQGADIAAIAFLPDRERIALVTRQGVHVRRIDDVLRGSFESNHADEEKLWWPARAADVLNWQQYKNAATTNFCPPKQQPKAFAWPGKEPCRLKIEKSLVNLLGGIREFKEMVPPRFPDFYIAQENRLAHWKLQGKAGTADVAVNDMGELHLSVAMQQPLQDEALLAGDVRAFVKEMWGDDPGPPTSASDQQNPPGSIEWRHVDQKAHVPAARILLSYDLGGFHHHGWIKFDCGTGPLEWKQLTVEELAKRHGLPTERKALAIATHFVMKLANRDDRAQLVRESGLSLSLEKLQVRNVVLAGERMSRMHWRVTLASESDWEAGRAIEVRIHEAGQIVNYSLPKFITGRTNVPFGAATRPESSNISIKCSEIQSWPEYAELEKRAEKKRLENSVLIDKHKSGIITHLHSLRRREVPELPHDGKFRVQEDQSGNKYVTANVGTLWGNYRLLENGGPELRSFGLTWSQPLEQTFSNPGAWRRFAEEAFVSAFGDLGTAEFHESSRGWINWTPTWRGLTLPYRFRGLLWISDSRGGGQGTVRNSFTWKKEDATLAELWAARDGLERYEFAVRPSAAIAGAVKSAQAMNEHLDISRTTIVAAEYRLVDLAQVTKSHAFANNVMNSQLVDALENRGPVAPLYFVEMCCNAPYPHSIAIGVHPETGEIVCQMDTTPKFFH